jgi:hypothetical protein
MKIRWIGQHIWDFISRFRNDVYLENLQSSNETTVLVVDGDGKITKNTVAGPKGDQGDPGPKGDQGDQGPSGTSGAAGTSGTNGVDGNDGAQGPIGLTGATGPQGPQGTQGPEGPRGIQGIQGPTGNTNFIAIQFEYPMSTWVLEHNLNTYPTVTLTDLEGAVISGNVVYTDSNTITVTFVSSKTKDDGPDEVFQKYETPFGVTGWAYIN